MRSGARRPAAASGYAAGPNAPLVINGWAIYVWPTFRDRWLAMRARVEELRRQDPIDYRSSRDVKFFKVLADLVLREIPAAPDAKEFRQGNTMGGAYVHWRRAKFMGRFRIFFRYHSEQRIIVYAWLNDEHTLRKAGASTDVYSVFRHMLERGAPPTNWNELVAACETWPSETAEG